MSHCLLQISIAPVFLNTLLRCTNCIYHGIRKRLKLCTARGSTSYHCLIPKSNCPALAGLTDALIEEEGLGLGQFKSHALNTSETMALLDSQMLTCMWSQCDLKTVCFMTGSGSDSADLADLFLHQAARGVAASTLSCMLFE